MSWLSVAIQTTAETAEPLSDALLAEGALSVTVTDAADGAFQEQPIFGEPGEFAGYWNECVVTALFNADADPAVAIDSACATLEITPITAYRTSMIDEQDCIRPHIRIFVNGAQIRELRASLRPTDLVHIVQALSGG